ncbi:unnamed protein product, partial [Brassica oleracea]
KNKHKPARKINFRNIRLKHKLYCFNLNSNKRKKLILEAALIRLRRHKKK